MQCVLFVCSRNRWRSPTAEQVFAGRPGIECASAGLSHDADTPLTPELVQWADLISRALAHARHPDLREPGQPPSYP